MIDWLQWIVTNLGTAGVWTTMIVSLILCGWYGRETYARIAALEKYRDNHERQYSIGLQRLDEMHEAVMELKVITANYDKEVKRLDREIYRLRDKQRD